MTKLCCVDYGFECDFAVESQDDSEMIQHGIEYSTEALMQFMLRKGKSEFSGL